MTVTRVTDLATAVRAPNAGPMTLEGTNTYVLRHPSSPSVVVVDPGPLDADHLARIAACGRVELILLTHRHLDHVEAAPELAARSGAPVRANDAGLCIDGPPLRDGEVVDAAGVRVEVIATPGHTADSISLLLSADSASDGDHGSLLTGDTILGRGRTAIIEPDGSVADHLASLERLEALGGLRVLPAHGPVLPSVGIVAAEYIAHRRARLVQVRDLLAALERPADAGDEELVDLVVDRVYAGSAEGVRFAARSSVRAQLEYLSDPRGDVTPAAGAAR